MTWSLVIAGIATIVPEVWELRSDPELHQQWTRSGVVQGGRQSVIWSTGPDHAYENPCNA